MAGGNRGGIVLPVAGCSELAGNWNPTNGEVDAITYQWAIECPVGSMEHRGRAGRDSASPWVMGSLVSREEAASAA